MLDRLGERSSLRKLALFAIACCRSAPALVTCRRDKRAVEWAERYLEGKAKVFDRRGPQTDDYLAMGDAANRCIAAARCAVAGSGEHVRRCTREVVDTLFEQSKPRDKWSGIVAHALRDIFGNPFKPVATDPIWRTPTVTTIAQSIYDERRFGDLPILADALEEAGCTNSDVLRHCREPGEHVRGCWVVDLLLGKE